MLLRVDVLARGALHAVQALALVLGHLAVGLGVRLGLVDVRLLLFELVGFLGRQLARGSAVGDAGLLVGFALVDARGGGRRGGLRERADGSDGQRGGDEGVFDWLCSRLLWMESRADGQS
ncbi:MAG: hypothetical protein ABI702_23905, partial [Burkholderiales bacterium]